MRVRSTPITLLSLVVSLVGCSSSGASGSGQPSQTGSAGASGSPGTSGAPGANGSAGASGASGSASSGGASGASSAGSGGASGASSAGSGGAPGASGSTGSGGASGASSAGSGGASGSAGSGGATGSGGLGTSPEAGLATALGKPARLLFGLGSSEQSDIQAQGISPDIFERYLQGSGQNLESGWQTYNSPEGAYVDIVANTAAAVGAVPMLTVYMSTARGEGNLAYLSDSAFMTNYWRLAKLVFQRLAAFDKPALVSVEPDFWGFVESQAPGGDPTKVAVQVTAVSDCAGYPNDLTGFAACYIHLARTIAPKSRIGFRLPLGEHPALPRTSCS